MSASLELQMNMKNRIFISIFTVMYIHGNTEYYAQKKNDLPCYFVHKTNKHIKAMTETIKTPDHRPTPDTAYNRKGARNNQKKNDNRVVVYLWLLDSWCSFILLRFSFFSSRMCVAYCTHTPCPRHNTKSKIKENSFSVIHISLWLHRELNNEMLQR